MNSQQFPYLPRDPLLGNFGFAPIVPITLTAVHTKTADALVDSGASVNVLPFSLGVALGFDWDKETMALNLTGNLAGTAKIVFVSAVIGLFPSVRLVFSWAENDYPPLILGQVNFFQEFDVCLFRSRETFDVRPRP